jgi:hypothetical protein
MAHTVAFGSFAFAAILTAMPARAQSAPTAQDAPVPAAAAREDEGMRARAVLDAFAAREHTIRIVGSYAGLIGGATTFGFGIAAESRYPRTFSPGFWIFGSTLLVDGVVGLLTRGPLESLAEHAGSQTDAALREGWAASARAAKRGRQIGGWMSVGLGTGAMAAGTALALGATDLSDTARTGWSAGLLIAGGITAGMGTATLLVKSETELGYQAAYGAEPPPVTVGFAPLPGGGAVSLAGTF